MELTHLNEQGRARMVDISDKQITARTAVARTELKVSKELLKKIKNNDIKKGDVFSVAQVAGIMAAKNTPQFIPMCHPIPITSVDITFTTENTSLCAFIHIEATVKTTAKTGVEMEALTAVTSAALTIYDMCKAIDKEIVIGPTYLVKKTGGKSGEYVRDGTK